MNLNRYEMKKAWTTFTHYHKIHLERLNKTMKPLPFRIQADIWTWDLANKSRSSTHSIPKLGTKHIKFFIDMGEITNITTANQHTAQKNTIHGNASQQYTHSTLEEMDLTIHLIWF